MFKMLHEIKLSEKCNSIVVDKRYDEFIGYSEGNLMRVYFKEDLVQLGETAEPMNVIKSENDIICANINAYGDSKKYYEYLSNSVNEYYLKIFIFHRISY